MDEWKRAEIQKNELIIVELLRVKSLMKSLIDNYIDYDGKLIQDDEKKEEDLIELRLLVNNIGSLEKIDCYGNLHKK